MNSGEAEENYFAQEVASEDVGFFHQNLYTKEDKRKGKR